MPPCSCNDPAKIAAREQRKAEQAARREAMREAQKQKAEAYQLAKAK